MTHTNALSALQRSISLQPSLAEAQYTIGVIYWQQGRFDESLAALRAALAARTDYAEAHYTLGSVLQQKGAVDAAIAEFREGIRLAPLSPEIHNSLASALRARGDVEPARLEFQEGTRLNKLKSDNQTAIFATNTGMAMAKRGDLTAAIERFHAAIRLDPHPVTVDDHVLSRGRQPLIDHLRRPRIADAQHDFGLMPARPLVDAQQRVGMRDC
jgi:tetratricopeptide (TPR) repeat protein